MINSSHPLKIILFEDNPDDANKVRLALESDTLRPTILTTVDCFRDGLKEVLTKPWDLILMSLSLPDLSGLDAVQEIQEIADSVPVIVMGRAGHQPPESGMLKEGVQDCLLKDNLSSEVLLRSIHFAVERSKAVSGYQARYRKFFESVLDASPAAVYATDVYENIDYWSAAAERVLGWKKEEVIGCPFSFFYGGLDELEETQRKLLREKRLKVHERECRGFRKDGVIVDLRLASSVIEDTQGRVVGTVTVISEILEGKQAQVRLLHADRVAAMGILIAGVAHEINNPLAQCIASLDLAADLSSDREIQGKKDLKALGKSLRTVLTHSRDGAERVRDIVRGLKVFASTDEAKTQIADLQQILGSVMEMATNQVCTRATFEKEFLEVPKVCANGDKLSQVFLNLILHAARSIPEGNPGDHQICLKTRGSESGEAVVEIFVTGGEISSEIIGRIYDPFFTDKPLGLGMGLGLSICFGIISAYGGQIEVENDLGAKGQFRITLPAAPPTEVGGTEQKNILRSSAKPISAGKPKLLIIDDEADLAEILSRLLNRSAEITVLCDPKKALQVLRSNPAFDVVLCDLMMPHISGMEIYETLKSEGSSYADKMVFMTGGAFTPRSTAFLAGVTNPRIEKPFGQDEIENLIQMISK